MIKINKWNNLSEINSVLLAVLEDLDQWSPSPRCRTPAVRQIADGLKSDLQSTHVVPGSRPTPEPGEPPTKDFDEEVSRFPTLPPYGIAVLTWGRCLCRQRRYECRVGQPLGCRLPNHQSRRICT